MDTIFALASAPGKAGVAVIRVSGDRAFDICRELCGALPKMHRASLRAIRSMSGEILDRGLVIAFPEGASFSGEETVELQVHGSQAIVARILQELGRFTGVRMAEAGEFTRRALENGQLDLTQVEGLADLIDAETEAQRLQAQRLFDGALGAVVNDWRADLLRAAALLEASIDFADEDVPEDVSTEVAGCLDRVIHSLQLQLRDSQVSERIRTGFEVAIIGAPNVGKSTLLNRLAGREAAITSDVAGTTRDIIEVRMDLGGLPVTFLDTAGLRETDDAIEAIGVARAKSRAAAADIRILLVEDEMSPAELEVPAEIVLRAKSDRTETDTEGVSGLTGRGVDRLVERVRAELSSRAQNAGLAVRERHRVAMGNALEFMTVARALVDEGQNKYDIGAEEIRSAIHAFDLMVGRIEVEELLGEIFASFCVGK